MMRQIEYKFNDKTYYLAFTAEALFTVYDKFGYTSDILTTTGCLESTAEGWKNCCYLAALMASQGELQRRRMGYRPADMLDMETLRTGLRPAEVPELRLAVRQALEEGFRRELAPDEPEEVNLVLAAREEAEKKRRRRRFKDLFPRFSSSPPWLRPGNRPPPRPRDLPRPDHGPDAGKGGS